MDKIIACEETYHQRTGERMADKTMKMTLFNCIDDETMKLAFPEKFDSPEKKFDDLVIFIKKTGTILLIIQSSTMGRRTTMIQWVFSACLASAARTRI